MATTLTIEDGSSGITIKWTPTTRSLDISGWFDMVAEIKGETLTLREFFEKLHITKDDCDRAWE